MTPVFLPSVHGLALPGRELTPEAGLAWPGLIWSACLPTHLSACAARAPLILVAETFRIALAVTDIRVCSSLRFFGIHVCAGVASRHFTNAQAIPIGQAAGRRRVYDTHTARHCVVHVQ